MSQEQKAEVMEADKPTESSDTVEVRSIAAEEEGMGENSITERDERENEESVQSSEGSIPVGDAVDTGVGENRNTETTPSIVEDKGNRRDEDVVGVKETAMDEEKGDAEKDVEEAKDEVVKIEKEKVNVKELATAKEGSVPQGGNAEEERGARGTGCFGVKSYLHHFYDAEKPPRIYNDFVEEDDFEFLVDPGKRRDRWCCWFRLCIWGGVNLLSVGIFTLLVGYLTPKRDVVVGFHDHLEILDRWAITFNQRLESCRIIGIVLFCLGGFVVLLGLVIAACANNGERQRCERSYTYITTTIVEPYKSDSSGVTKIPITEEIKSIQPAGDVGPVATDKAIVVQMPYY